NREFEEIEGLSAEKIEKYRNQLQEIRERLTADGLPNDAQMAIEAGYSTDNIPKKEVEGYKIEEVKAAGKSQLSIDTSIWRWVVFSLLVSYSIFYFFRRRLKNTKD
ncbi:MAG: hypothetical protein ACFB2Y_01925, partial [Fulvivirga sp.]